MRSPAIVLVLALLLTGCSTSASAPNRSEAVIADSAGTTIVTSHTPQWTPATAWRVDSTPITMLGADERDPQQQWRWFDDVARFSNGDLVVAVRGELRRFAADGRFLRIISREGDGPGEFRYVSDLDVLPGDSLRVGTAWKTAIFGPDGRLVREERLDLERWNALGRWSECNSGSLPDGSRYGCMRDSTIPQSASNRADLEDEEGGSSPGPGLLRQLRRVHLVPPTLDRTMPLGIEAGIEQFGITIAPGRETFVVHPFYAISAIAGGGSPLRLAIATNPEYRIELWTMDGRLERIIRRLDARQRPSQADRDSAMAGVVRDLMRFDKMPDGRARDLARTVPVPDSLPAISRLFWTATGELVVARPVGLSAYEYDVFASEGAWLGTFTLPPRTYPRAIGRDHIVALQRNDDDLSLVVVLPLHRP